MGLRDDILAFRPYNEQEETEKRLMLQYMDTFPDLLTRGKTRWRILQPPAGS